MLKSMGSLFAMLVFCILGVSVCSYILLQAQFFQYLDVAVVIPEEEKESQIIAQYISSMDSVESICSFHYLELDEAMEGLEENQFQAVIALPQNFYEDIYVGENTPATIYLPENAELNVKVFQELFLDGVSIVQISEAGVYASLNTAKYKQTQIELRDIGDFVVTMYVEAALKRENIYDKYTESPFGQMNMYQYYGCALFTVFLLLCGLNFGFLYQSHGRAVEEKLRMYGIGQGKISFIKILVMAGALWSLGMVLYLLFCLLTGMLSGVGIWFAGESVLTMFFLCISMAAYFHVVYVITGGGLQGTILLLVLDIGMILCSGTVLPAAYLPEIVSKVGSIMPINFWSGYSAGILFGEVEWKQLLTAVGFAATGIGVGVISECKNM